MKGMKMDRISSITLSIITFGIILPFIGCQNSSSPSPSSETRQSKLLTAENHRLQVQLQQLETRSAKLTKDYKQCTEENEKGKKETAELTTNLQQCNEEKEKIKKDAEDTVSFTMTTVREECKQETKLLQDENEQLKAQIQKLEEELKRLKVKSATATP
jgi:archaellum component FlaC